MVQRAAALGLAGRRRLSLMGLVVAVLTGLWLIARGDPKEQPVAETIQAVLEAAAVSESELPGPRDQRVQAALDRLFTDPVTVRHADLPKTGAGRRALLLWARLLGRFEVVELAVEHQTIELSPPTSATSAVAKMDVVLDAQKAGQRLREQRSVEVGLVLQDGRWQIEAIEVAAQARREPEARP